MTELGPVLSLRLIRNFSDAGNHKVLHGDIGLRSDALIVLFVNEECRRFYAKGRPELKSRSGCRDFYLRASRGDLLQHVRRIGELSPVQLQKIGFHVEGFTSQKKFGGMTVDNPEVVLQDILAKKLFKYKFELQKIRLAAISLYMYAFPWCCVLLSDEEPEVREQMVKELQRLGEQMDHAKKQRSAFWER